MSIIKVLVFWERFSVSGEEAFPLTKNNSIGNGESTCKVLKKRSDCRS